MKKGLFAVAFLLFFVLVAQTVHAQTQRTIQFQATINPGALLADIRDRLGRSISQPILELGKINNSVDCRSSESPISATLGVDDQRLYVDNPKAAFDGWTLSIAPVDGSSAQWTNANNTHAFDINDMGENGCLDGDGDGVGGVLAIDPSDAQIFEDCLECTKTNLSVGSSVPIDYATHSSITLLQAAENSDDLGSWYITNIGVSQTIPAGQEGDTYALEMVLTATAM